MTLRRLRIPLLTLCALVVALVFAATAAAEKKGGEVESPVDLSIPGEADVLKASAVYEVATGTLTATFTTREALGSHLGEGATQIEYVGGLVTSSRPCTRADLEEEGKAGAGFPSFALYTFNFGGPHEFAPQFSLFQTHEEKSLDPSKAGPATRSTAGTTFTLTGTDARAANGAFTCVEIVTAEVSGGVPRDFFVFPLAVLPDPPPVVPPTPPVAESPAPAPATLTVAKPRAMVVSLKKWTRIRIAVTNTGGVATTAGSLKLKLPRTLKVRPVSSRQQIPAIGPGQTWNVAFRVKATEKTRRRSTISFVAGAGPLTARGSIVAMFAG